MLRVRGGGNGIGVSGGFSLFRGGLARVKGIRKEGFARACRGRGGGLCRGIAIRAFISVRSVLLTIVLFGVRVIIIYNLFRFKGWTNLNIENPRCH